jgi:hypothetical protein
MQRTVLAGMEQIEHRDREQYEREHRQADAQSPNDPSFREQFQVFSNLWSTQPHRETEASRDRPS